MKTIVDQMDSNSYERIRVCQDMVMGAKDSLLMELNKIKAETTEFVRLQELMKDKMKRIEPEIQHAIEKGNKAKEECMTINADVRKKLAIMDGALNKKYTRFNDETRQLRIEHKQFHKKIEEMSYAHSHVTDMKVFTEVCAVYGHIMTKDMRGFTNYAEERFR